MLLVITNVKLVKVNLTIVSPVTVSESMLQFVTVQITTSKTTTTPVLNVIQNVLLVKTTEPIVPFVPSKELITLHNVHAQPDNMKLMKLVTLAHTNVLPVKVTLKTVCLVPTKPDNFLIVTVKLDTSTSELKLNAVNVTSNVTVVSITPTTVPFVPPPEFKDLNQLAHVKTTNMLMKTVNVNLVDIDVLLVKDLLITVPNVPATEPQPPLVHVQPDIMKLLKVKLNVTLVTKDVINVKTLTTIVSFVPMKESPPHQHVHVTMDTLKLTMLVKFVTGIVLLVLTPLEIVKFVLQTELKPQLVLVQMVLMKFLDNLNVQLVPNNATNVKIAPTTV